ncbi:unnamed protein product [Cylindrotheca closterium]|uniref:Uncharacterized protein n=2 Tax=Cylindrotheca closterium TaxID=2856 RepID=A0AAD2CCR3_9STRA|nr:unnamed protein product [Cylindrotheca closterium]
MSSSISYIPLLLLLLSIMVSTTKTVVSAIPLNLPEADEVVKCPMVKEIDFTTEIEIADPNVAREWNEVSGLAVSPTQIAPSGAPIMWGHNDGRDQAEFGTNFAAWDPVTGERLVTFILPYDETSDPPLVNQDWEDMTIGSCGNTAEEMGETCIYLADLGDNYASDVINTSIRPADRPYRIYKIKEPVLAAYARTSARSISYPATTVTALEIDYLDASSPARTGNSEGVFLDHAGWGRGGAIGDIYIVTKSRDFGRLYKVPASAWPTNGQTYAKYSPQVVGSNYNDGEFRRFLWTSASMSWDGTKIIMGTVHRNYVFLRCPGQTVEEAIVGRDACMIWENPPEAADDKKQFEAVAWYPNGNTVLNIAESLTMVPRIVKVNFDYSFPPSFCPAVGFDSSGTQGTVCQTFPTSYDGENFVSQVVPDSWCVDAMKFYGSPAPSITASESPSATPSAAPTASGMPTNVPTTPEPTINFFFGDLDLDDNNDRINGDEDSGAASALQSSFTFGMMMMVATMMTMTMLPALL